MFKLFLATPESKLVGDAEVLDLTVPGHAGELNILPGHSPLMTSLEAGILSYRLANGESDRFAISWGYCQVSPEGVSVLVETAMKKESVDVNSLTKSIADLELKAAQDVLEDADWESLQKDIATARAQISLVQ